MCYFEALQYSCPKTGLLNVRYITLFRNSHVYSREDFYSTPFLLADYVRMDSLEINI